MNLLLEWMVEGVAIAAVATLVVRLVPPNSAAQRHAFWWLALACVLALPLMPGVFAQLAAVVVPSVGSSDATVQPALTVPPPPEWLVSCALGLWALVALVSLVRLAANLRTILVFADAAVPLSAVQEARLRRFVAARASSRPARVYISNDVRGACAVGFIRPRILLSADLVAVLDDEAIEAIVLHEYAHLQRFDDWTRLLQRAVLVVAGLHPAVRWISRQIDVEREVACDRMVVERTGAPAAYARSLTMAAELSARMTGFTPVVSPGASMSGHGLRTRVMRLLSGRVASRPVAWSAVAGSAATLAVAVTAAVRMPPLVVVASLERPVLALVSVPLRSGFVRGLPGFNQLVLEQQEVDAGSIATPAVVNDRPRAIASPASQSSPPDSGAVPAADPAVLRTVDPTPSPSPLEPLPASATILQLVMPPHAPREAGSIDVRSDEQVAQRGADVAGALRLGAATGMAAARAGTSIGRFFKKGGLAIANSF